MVPILPVFFNIRLLKCFQVLSLQEIKSLFHSALERNARGGIKTLQSKNQHVLFLSCWWLPDCLQTTAEGQNVSEGNLIAGRQSHGCSRVLLGGERPRVASIRSILRDYYGMWCLIAVHDSASLPSLFLFFYLFGFFFGTAGFAFKTWSHLPRLYYLFFPPHFRVIDIAMWGDNLAFFTTPESSQ